MWLVLCPSNDEAALWAYEGLKARQIAPLELVSAEELACSLRWEHRVSADGASVAITLADRRTINSGAVRGIVNRLSYIPQEHLAMASPADREYAAQELMAFYMSWLYAMPQPVLNRPTAQGLSGAWRHISEWVWLAGKAGLPTLPYRQSGFDEIDEGHLRGGFVSAETPVNTVIVIDGHVVGESPPPDIAASCKRLAGLAGAGLLGIQLVAGPESSWTFAGATPLPDLRLGGEALLDVMAAALQGGGR
ncbi:MAG: hypothetical protein IDH49_03580 [Gammaproteobacteria bacterium]|nr:hypothetical protein [Gammaproteobacteria bacterium]